VQKIGQVGRINATLGNIVVQGAGRSNDVPNHTASFQAQCDAAIDLSTAADPVQDVQDALNQWNLYDGAGDQDAYRVCVTGTASLSASDTSLRYYDGTGQQPGPYAVLWSVAPTNSVGDCGIHANGYPVACNEPRNRTTTRPLFLHFEDVVIEWDRSVAQTQETVILETGDGYLTGGVANYEMLVMSGHLTVSVANADTTVTTHNPVDFDQNGFGDTDVLVGWWLNNLIRADLGNFEFEMTQNTTGDDYRTVGIFNQGSFSHKPAGLKLMGLGVGWMQTATANNARAVEGNIRNNKTNFQFGVPASGCNLRYYVSNVLAAGHDVVKACTGFRFTGTYESGVSAIAVLGNISQIVFQDAHHEFAKTVNDYHSHLLGAGYDNNGRYCMSDAEAATNGGTTCNVPANWGTGSIEFRGGRIGSDQDDVGMDADAIVFGENADYELILSDNVDIGRITDSIGSNPDLGLIFNTATTDTNTDATVRLMDYKMSYNTSHWPSTFDGQVIHGNKTWYSADCNTLARDQDYSRQGDTCIDIEGAGIGDIYTCTNTSDPEAVNCVDGDWKLTATGATEGTGDFVREASPTLTTPVIGTATGTSLALTGILTAAVSVESTGSTSHTVTAAEGQWLMADETGTTTITLPGASQGASVCIYSTTAQTVNVSPVAGDDITINGAVQAAAKDIISPGAIGDFVCLLGENATNWRALGLSGAWTVEP
jgi:hypothetical protein